MTAVALTLATALPTWADNDELANVARDEMCRLAERWAYEPPRAERPREVTQPELAFAKHFHQHVAVPLRRTAWLHAVYLAHGLETWGEAYWSTMNFAGSRGARHLSDDYYRDLGDAVAEQLVAFIAAHDAGCSGTSPCSVAYPGDAP
jgi:hypothetical protein